MACVGFILLHRSIFFHFLNRFEWNFLRSFFSIREWKIRFPVMNILQLLSNYTLDNSSWCLFKLRAFNQNFNSLGIWVIVPRENYLLQNIKIIHLKKHFSSVWEMCRVVREEFLDGLNFHSKRITEITPSILHYQRGFCLNSPFPLVINLP